jgi:outer membrane immunogenic protein
MRHVAFVAAAFVFSGSAYAADMPLKAAPMLSAPFSWTGWYIGATAGYGWTNQGIDNTVTSTSCAATPIVPKKYWHDWEREAEAAIALPPSPCPAFGAALAAAIPVHFNTDPKGFIGGGEIGYNAQIGQFVWGIEADVSGADIKGSDTQAFAAVVPGFPANTVSVLGTASEKLDFLATIRGRLGFTLTPPLLVYATGGFAFGHVSASTTLTETVTPCGCVSPSQTVAASSSATLPGWTVGAGLEWMFAPNWSLKGEYLYYDLGTLSFALPGISQTVIVPGFSAAFGANVNSIADVKGNIVRVGVNYHF